LRADRRSIGSAGVLPGSRARESLQLPRVRAALIGTTRTVQGPEETMPVTIEDQARKFMTSTELLNRLT
jgi:hypothetical protein